jgi:hypothetical protein
MKLTANFSLKEFIEGEMPKEAIKMNYDLLTDEQQKNIGLIAIELQKLRDKTKAEFGSKFTGFKITSGLRQKAWELKQKRSGNSQHVKGWAVDFQPICSNEDYLIIFGWVFKQLENFNGGVAQKKPNLKAGLKGFIHLDLRGSRARWEY